jgi:hypothetical protein
MVGHLECLLRNPRFANEEGSHPWFCVSWDESMPCEKDGQALPPVAGSRRSARAHAIFQNHASMVEAGGEARERQAGVQEQIFSQ